MTDLSFYKKIAQIAFDVEQEKIRSEEFIENHKKEFCRKFLDKLHANNAKSLKSQIINSIKKGNQSLHIKLPSHCYLSIWDKIRDHNCIYIMPNYWINAVNNYTDKINGLTYKISHKYDINLYIYAR